MLATMNTLNVVQKPIYLVNDNKKIVGRISPKSMNYVQENNSSVYGE